MRHLVGLVLTGLLSAASLAGADVAACSATKGLYEIWLGTQGRSVPRVAAPAEGLLAGSILNIPDVDRRQAIGRGYQAFFKVLSDSAKDVDAETVRSCWREAGSDRLAALVCEWVLYMKTGRTDAKSFVEAFPAGRKGAELIWDLDAVSAEARNELPALFLPKGPAYKLIDELFLMMMDDRDKAAAAKYFGLVSFSSGDGERYLNEQIKVLVRESPSVVVKQWQILRQHRPRLKKLAAELNASLPPAEAQKVRLGLQAFCTPDSPDCDEILKTFSVLKER